MWRLMTETTSCFIKAMDTGTEFRWLQRSNPLLLREYLTKGMGKGRKPHTFITHYLLTLRRVEFLNVLTERLTHDFKWPGGSAREPSEEVPDGGTDKHERADR